MRGKLSGIRGIGNRSRESLQVLRSFAAVRDVTFKIPKGEIVAFLGPNGAGKSTMMKILTGYMAPTSGSAKILGKDVNQNRLQIAKHIGYLPENGPLYGEMTPKTMLHFFGQARGIPASSLRDRINYVIETFQLNSVASKPIHKLSKGFKQRVGMAQAILHEPEVLIMDEPTSGLDPNQIHETRRVIKELGKTTTILLSTHVLQEVEAIAQRVIMISEGRVVFDDRVEEFRKSGEMEQTFARLTNAKLAAV